MNTIRIYKTGQGSGEIEEELIKEYFSKGYDYEDRSSETKDLSDPLVKTPSGRVWRLDDCFAVLSKKLEFGNQEQIEAIKTIEILNLLYNWKFPWLNLDKLKNRELVHLKWTS